MGTYFRTNILSDIPFTTPINADRIKCRIGMSIYYRRLSIKETARKQAYAVMDRESGIDEKEKDAF